MGCKGARPGLLALQVSVLPAEATMTASFASAAYCTAAPSAPISALPGSLVGQATREILMTRAPASAARRTAEASAEILPYPSGISSGPFSLPAPLV